MTNKPKKHPLSYLMFIVILPYYRFYRVNTEYPFEAMLQDAKNPVDFLTLYERWRKRKLAELQYTLVACTILAAAVIGSFSWDGVPDAYWLTSAFWYYSLVLSVLGILLGAQLTSAIEHLGRPTVDSKDEEKKAAATPSTPALAASASTQTPEPMSTQANGNVVSFDHATAQAAVGAPSTATPTPRSTGGLSSTTSASASAAATERVAEKAKEAARYMPLILTPINEDRTRWALRKKTLFIWQCPMMFMSYSALGFMGGLTMFVVTPLIRREYVEWNSRVNISIIYLATLGIAGGMYIYCSFWIFHYVDLRGEAQNIYMMKRHASVDIKNEKAREPVDISKNITNLKPTGDSNV